MLPMSARYCRRRPVPIPPAKIRRQDDRARLIPLGYDLEEQIRLNLAEREVVELDHQPALDNLAGLAL